MTLAEAVQAVMAWLCHTGSTFALTFVRQVSETQFELGVEQLAPTHKRRVFAIAREETPDCWRVEEIQAA